MTSPEPPDPAYVAARSVLLDAVRALDPHLDAVILVGAQAVYLRTGSAGLTIAAFTTDADLAVDPAVLGERPPLLEAVMTAGGFTLQWGGSGIRPGRWLKTTAVDGTSYEVPVDLIVPAGALPGGNTRGARLPAHGKQAAMRTRGLEAALVDNNVLPITGLAPHETRRAELKVAGSAALLVAKVIKLAERVDAVRTHRLKDKDAADVLRLVRATRPGDLATRLNDLTLHPTSQAVTVEALLALQRLFRSPESPGVQMAVRALEQDLPASAVQTQLTAFANYLRNSRDRP